MTTEDVGAAHMGFDNPDGPQKGPKSNEMRPIANADQFVSVKVYTQLRDDGQWGVFDFEQAKFDEKRKSVCDQRHDGSELSFEAEQRLCYACNIELCSMQGRGSNVITRKSRYEMGMLPPNEASAGQIQFGSLMIVHHADHYEVY